MITRDINIAQSDETKYSKVELVQNDLNAYKIVMDVSKFLTNANNPQFKVTAFLANDTTIEDTGVITDGIATYTLKNSMYSAVGELTLRLSLVDEISSTTVQTIVFNVVEGIDGAVEADDRYPILTNLIIQANEAIAQAKEIESELPGLKEDLLTETAARQNIDENLSGRIDDEETERQNADTAISNNLTSHINNKLNPHEVTKAQVGLSNVLNVEQAAKTDLLAETTARQNADEMLGNNVTDLDGRISDEVTARREAIEEYKKSSSKMITPYTLEASKLEGYIPILKVHSDLDFKVKWDESGDGFLDIIFDTGKANINTQLGMVAKTRTGAWVDIPVLYFDVLDNDIDYKEVLVGLKLYDNGNYEVFKYYGVMWNSNDTIYGQIEPSPVVGGDYVIYPLADINFYSSTATPWFINGIADDGIKIYAGSKRLATIDDFDTALIDGGSF